jgi:hypothetical protein
MNLTFRIAAFIVAIAVLLYGLSRVISPPSPGPAPTGVGAKYDAGTGTWYVTWKAPSNQGNNGDVQNLTYYYSVTLLNNSTVLQSGNTTDTQFALKDPQPFATYTVTLYASDVVSQSASVSANVSVGGVEQIKNLQFQLPLDYSKPVIATGSTLALTSPDTEVVSSLDIIGPDKQNYGTFPGTCTFLGAPKGGTGQGSYFSCSYPWETAVPPTAQLANSEYVASAYLKNQYGSSMSSFTSYKVPIIPPGPPTNIAVNFR